MKGLSADHIEFRASEFVARLYSGEMGVDDELRLDGWLSESGVNKVEYQTALQLWHDAGALEERMMRPRLRPSMRALLVAAALLVMALGLLLLPYGTQLPQEVIRSYATITGEQKTVTLPDGTVAILNTNTRLLVDYSDQQRRLVLERGQAFFDVVRDEARPLTVDTGGRAATALGTRFDLQKDGLDLKVSVLEGNVAVHRPGIRWLAASDALDLLGSEGTLSGAGIERYHLGAGVEATFSGYFGSDGAAVAASRLQEPERFPFWRFGFLRFDDMPLYRAIKELNRYAKHKILIEDAGVMNVKVSGVFRVSDIESSLKAFEKVLPIQVSYLPDRVVVVGRN